MSKKSLAGLFLVLAASLWGTAALADGGGDRDPSTQLVWSQSTVRMTNSYWDWRGCTALAAAYSVTENGVVYDDWRLPTRAELHGVIEDQFILNLTDPYYLHFPFYTSEVKGKKWAWAVTPDTDMESLLSQVNAYFQAVFVRGP